MNHKAIVDTYVSKIRPHAEAELDWFRQQPTLESAIDYAARATNSKGKRYAHQRRITRVAIQSARQVLLANSPGIEHSRSFEELFDLLEAMLKPIHGIGELYIYDTCLRISAKLDLLPDKVYLHAGVREGAKKLGFDAKAKTLKKEDFRQEFGNQLEPHEIEDVLCIFKDEFRDVHLKDVEAELRKNSWCA